MADKPKFPWGRLLYAIGSNLPPVKEFLKTTVNGLERQPELVRFVEQFQTVDQKDCLICLAHGIAHQKRLTLEDEPPEHWCPRRADRCGCGKPAARTAEYKGREKMRVCQDFPGCIPKTGASSRGIR